MATINMTGKVTKVNAATAMAREQKTAVTWKYFCVCDIKWAERASSIIEKMIVTTVIYSDENLEYESILLILT